MGAEIKELTELAYEGSNEQLTMTPVVGTPERTYPRVLASGSGALANFNGLRLPVTATTKVFLSHLHADHVGDIPTLLWSLAKSGRRARRPRRGDHQGRGRDPPSDHRPIRLARRRPVPHQRAPMAAPHDPPAWWADALITD